MNFENKEYSDYEGFDNINEIMDYYDSSHETNHQKIDKDTEFWGHCSNIEAWVENDYNWKILDTSLAFPILRKILRHYIYKDDPYNFRRIFLKVVTYLDDYYSYLRWKSKNNDRAKEWVKKWEFLSITFYKPNFLTKEEIEGCEILQLLKTFDQEETKRKIMQRLERVKREKRKKNRNYYERKIWGSSTEEFDIDHKLGCKDWLEYRRLLRRIRNGEEPVTSDKLDYLPYLYAKGEFTKWCNRHLYTIYTKNKIIWIIRTKGGSYYKYETVK